MKTINKFILKSYMGPMVMTFFIVMFILLLNFLYRYIDEFVGRGLPFSVILEFLFYATGTMIPLGLPLATLLAAIMTMGNLGENNELLALKAAGISLPKIIKPIFIVAVLISIGSYFLINNFVPYSFKKMGTILYDIRQQRQEIEFKDGIFFNGIPDISIRVGKQSKETKKLTNVLIYDTRDPQNSKTIVADSGYIDLSTDKRFLRVKLYEGQMYEETRNSSWYDKPSSRHNIFKQKQMFIPIDGFNFQQSGASVFGEDFSQSKNIKELGKDIDSLRAISNEKTDKLIEASLKKYLYRADTSILRWNDSIAAIRHQEYALKKNDLDTMSLEMKNKVYGLAVSRLNELKYFFSGEHDDVRFSATRMHRSIIDWHKKVSLPVSIMIFFLIGAPLGAIIRKGGLGTPVVISVMFFVIYYVITMTGEKMVGEGAWNPIFGMWLSTIILTPLAIFLTYKAKSDSALLNSEAYTMKIKKIYIIINRYYKKFNHGKDKNK